MYQKEIPMIFLEKKALLKLKKDLNQKEEILEPKTTFLFRCFIQAENKCTVSEEDKSVNIAKVQEMFQELFIRVTLVEELEK